MKLSILQEGLKRGLAIAGHAIAAKSTLPVLSHYLLRATDYGLTIQATNLEIGITAQVGAKVEESGAVCVPAKLLSDVVGGLPNDRVALTLDTEKQALTLVCAGFTSTIKGISADEFPVIPTIGEGATHSILLTADVIRNVGNRVAIVAADGTTRPVLAGVHMKGYRDTAHGDDCVVFCAVDGSRLARLQVQIEQPFDYEVIIPARAIAELARIVDDESGVNVALAPGGGQVVFSNGAVELVSRLIEGKYPDVDRIIPTSFATRTVLDRAELIRAAKLGSFFAVAQSKDNPIVRLNITSGGDLAPGKIEISANAAEVGDNKGVLDALVHGDGGKIAVNYKYLADALNSIDTPQIALEMNGETHPLVIKPVGSDGYIHICMPMTLR